jgi:hypothetical protein
MHVTRGTKYPQSIRIADLYWRRRLVEELYVSAAEMERLIRDPYANYVVQTAVSDFRPA